MNKLIHGDCLEKLKELEPNSIDTIITDPPYGISFMGRCTTGIACKNTSRDFVGIEMNEEYIKIAKARIND